MTFCIITHVPHGLKENQFFAYAPYVREMNIWLKYVDEVILVASLEKGDDSAIHLNYEHKNIQFVSIPKMDLLGLKAILRSVWYTPKTCWNIYNAMKNADHIHLRCPGNIGLLGCFIQILFPRKAKTAKYAGNWDPNSAQPFSYRIQKWILNNTLLTKNMQALVYGEWEGSSKNIKPFFTATYREEDKVEVVPRILNDSIYFLYVGTLSEGKRPLYAIQIIEKLTQLGYNVSLDFFGEGKEKEVLQNYCDTNQLNAVVDFKGNQTEAVVREAYKECHFLLLPSESEGWPKVVAEAMFWGCYPITTKVSCLGYMLDNGSRGLFLEINLDADVEQIIAVLKDQGDYNAKVLKSILWSRKYTLDLFENEIKGLLNS
ncbi:glycosyltransferase family 4 protein [Flavobacterium psychrotolerans]|uniref:Glycosyl transferase n=1 Tax=Flavobacterium psychrotolerans TaxID=2169410 RepID=A0A2U1JRA7_9FLAO|nr:glycosyltransferase [Flavobacterium psychrotolerans]PWA07489.1 glycosyl transferase [Flavobacterium psychrotolerans]